MAQLNHPNLGALKGLAKAGDVTQFHNIPYAVAERFSSPIVFTGKLSGDVYDASKLGPTVVQPVFTQKGEFGLIQKELPGDPIPFSEKKGLNLVVTVPPEASANSSLPVFVWIHGGGFIGGSGHWQQYDHSALIAMSSKLGMPMIGVAINYRLGALGFLTSSELAKAGLTGNYGLKDQRCALEWVQENIAGFGGNPKNVTLIGQSAGGVSTTLQFYSPQPLFRRAAAMGGTSILMGPQPIQFHDMVYPGFLAALGIDPSLPVEEKVKLLKEVPEGKFAELPPSLPNRPVLDGEFVSEIPSFRGLADRDHEEGRPEWLESVMFTDCEADGHILRFGFMKHTDIAKGLTQWLQSNLPSEASSKLLSDYNITSDLSDDEALTKILDIISSVMFYCPAVAYSKAFSGRSYLLHFDAQNPFPGPLSGRASHILDVAYLFQNYNSHLSAEDRKIAETFAEKVILFVNGKKPWSLYDDKGTAFVLGGGKSGEEGYEGYEGRKKGIWDVLEMVGGDKLVGVLFGYMASAH